MKPVYVFDACCGWSRGFAGTQQEVVRHSDLPVETELARGHATADEADQRLAALPAT